MSDQRVTNVLERTRPALALAMAACAVAMVVAGFFAQSSRWTDFTDGQSMAWTDGIKPWAIWAAVGGLTVLALLVLVSWNDQWLIFGTAGLFVFWRAGTEAAAYRSQIESDAWATVYDPQEIAIGLKAVPIVGTVGAAIAALLIVVTLATCFRLRASGGSPTLQS